MHCEQKKLAHLPHIFLHTTLIEFMDVWITIDYFFINLVTDITFFSNSF